MKTAILQSFLHFAVLSIFFLFACRQLKRIPIIALCLFVLLVLLDNIILIGLHKPAMLHGLALNCYDQLLEAILALAFILLYRTISFKEYGFTTSIDTSSFTPIIVVFLSIVLFVDGAFYLSNGFSGASLKNLLYKATLPGIAQELFFRGALLGLLNHSFSKPWKIFGAQMGWGIVITSILYGLIHGLVFNAGFTLYFNPVKILITACIGFALGWAKERSGSLIPSVIGHNLVNVAAAF